MIYPFLICFIARLWMNPNLVGCEELQCRCYTMSCPSWTMPKKENYRIILSHKSFYSSHYSGHKLILPNKREVTCVNWIQFQSLQDTKLGNNHLFTVSMKDLSQAKSSQPIMISAHKDASKLQGEKEISQIPRRHEQVPRQTCKASTKREENCKRKKRLKNHLKKYPTTNYWQMNWTTEGDQIFLLVYVYLCSGGRNKYWNSQGDTFEGWIYE